MSYPYVVSGDAHLLLKEWAQSNGFEFDEYLFHGLRATLIGDLRRIFGKVEYVDGEELREGLHELVQNHGVAPISLDYAYYRTRDSLKLSRHVDSRNRDIDIAARYGSKPLSDQIGDLQFNEGDVALVDDVIYTGDLVLRLAETLKEAGLRVTHAFAGVGVGAGTNRIRQTGIHVACVREYLNVIDEVCERDFFPGVPYSGRSLVNSENVGIPYLLPWGLPGRWASIPKKYQIDFSATRILDSRDLYREIERISGKPVTMNQLGRKFPTCGINSNSVFEVLDRLYVRFV
ncbi:phosphoribosyltransferase [Patescibacteria group bacterium]|nr:phosphoribosyltransferase [Patescibacteria group bacterium]